MANDPSNPYRREKRAGNPALPEKTGRYFDAIKRHVERYWGNCDNVFGEMVSAYVHLDVLIVKATAERPFHTLITSGMSDRPMSVPDGLRDQRLAELVICLPADWPMDAAGFKDANNYWPIRLLKATARFPHEYASWLARGHALPNGEPPKPYADNTDCCCALLADPVLCEEAGRTLQVDHNTTVRFLSVIPIFREEMDFALKESPAALQDELNAANITELLDIGRRNVRTRPPEDYKFFCPHCGQRLSGEASWVGMEIPCPACQTKIVVPQPPGAGKTLGIAASTPRPAYRPSPGLPRSATGAGGPRASRLALASLLIALLTIPLHAISPSLHIVLGVLGFGAAIVCGHLALARLRADRSLTGAWMARTGLAVGYTFVGLALLVGGLYLVGLHGLHQTHPGPAGTWQPPVSTGLPSQSAPRQSAPTGASEPQVTTDPASVTIPEAPASGTLKGQPFKADRARLLGQALTLDQGRGAVPEAEFVIYLDQTTAGAVAGKEFRYPQAGKPFGYSIHYRGKGGSGIATRNYSLRVVFGTPAGNVIPGRLYLELPENLETKIAGTFQAEVR